MGVPHEDYLTWSGLSGLGLHDRMLHACFWKALRNIIAKSPPSLPEPEAKTCIAEKINEFINTRITLAAEEIAKNAITKIREGDVILTYGRFV